MTTPRPRIPLNIPSSWETSTSSLPSYRQTGHCGETCDCPGDPDDEDVLLATLGPFILEVGWVDETYICNLYDRRAHNPTIPFQSAELQSAEAAKNWIEKFLVQFAG